MGSCKVRFIALCQKPWPASKKQAARTPVGPKGVPNRLPPARQALRVEGGYELAGGSAVLQRGAADGPLPAPLVAHVYLVPI